MSVTVTRPVRRRPRFHALPVRAVDRLTDDALAITFLVPPELRDAFAFQAGQHVTVRVSGVDGARRSYSLCSTPGDLAATGRLRIGVKEIPGGAFSARATSLRPGDTVEVLPPLGRFTTAFDPARARHYGAVAAGSGITPVLSLIATALSTEDHSRFTLLYGNRYARSVMFAEELADLKDRYPARLHLVHVLSREPRDAALLSGRLDAPRLAALFDTLLDVSDVDEWFLCGPYGMVLAAREVLATRGASTVHSELFHVDGTEPPPPARAPEDGGDVAVTIRLDGRESSFTMGRDERVLDAALRVRGELPYSCRGGVCSTCRARVLDGEVRMAHNYALAPDELAAGYVLTCQSSPVTDTLRVDYDAG
ncbi:MAG TPA: 1,2-phenylacetyl-CoA epoxidase subunit PaaE [Rugosimonospora sp.]|nr:1,2-phenylacetyl-CoA epoxidase subunit PaaE [Rugosimonospora sp.]